MSPKKIDEKITPFSLRLSEDLKQKCIDLSEKENLSLNEWIKRTLSNIVSPFDDDYNEENISLLNKIDLYVKNPNVVNIHSRAEFLRKASNILLNAETCSECGAINYGDGNYCNECGKLLYWEHPYNKYFIRYFWDYMKEHPLPIGWSYSTASPSYENQDCGFTILKLQDNNIGHMVVVKHLNTDDLEDIKKEMDKNKDDLINKFYEASSL